MMDTKRFIQLYTWWVSPNGKRQFCVVEKTGKLINDKLTRDVEAANDKHRADELSKNEKKRTEEARATKQLFDNEYKEFVALSDAKLVNAKDNADAIYQAKLERLQREYEYNRRKLQMEADEEKAKNRALIQDADQRAQAEQSIDNRLKAQLTAADTKYEQDKTRLHEENLSKRKEDVKSFFSAVTDAMNGDYTSFMKILTDKLFKSMENNAADKKDFKLTAQDKLELASLALTAMTQMNQKYLENQLKKIQTEKNEQLKSWEAQYKSGKISKDEYEQEVAKINADAAEKEKAEKLKAWKRDQALQVGMALMNAAQAALKSLAMLGWPLGLIGVAAAAISAGIQIATIKRQQPPGFAKGGKGYVKNAGVVKGDRHGSSYGDAGIKMVNRRTGEEVGEMEGDEPFMILSRNTYKNNRETVDKLLHSSLHRNGAPIYRDGGTYGDFVGNRPSFGPGKLGKRSFLYGGVENLSDTADYGGGGSDGGSGNYNGGGDVNDLSGVGSDPSVQDATSFSGATGEEIKKSQALMDNISENTEATVAELKGMNKFLAGPFLDSLKAQNDDFSTIIKGQTNQLVNGQGTANGLLERIAAKELSVSVQTFVNVYNQINVVNQKSDL